MYAMQIPRPGGCGRPGRGEAGAGRSGATGNRPQAGEAATPRPPVKTSPGIGPGMGVGTEPTGAYHGAFGQEQANHEGR